MSMFRGEVCVRGPTIFQGYYRDPTQTAEVLDTEGWLHTGDVGLWLPGGRLKIVDRWGIGSSGMYWAERCVYTHGGEGGGVGAVRGGAGQGGAVRGAFNLGSTLVTPW